MTPELVPAFELQVAVGPAPEVCPMTGGDRRIVPILGGSVTGLRLTGAVLPGGADWQVVGADGLTSLVARCCIRADDGALLTIVNTGLRHGPAAVMARVRALPVEDFMTHGGQVRIDGRVVRDIKVLQAKAPGESAGSGIWRGWWRRSPWAGGVPAAGGERLPPGAGGTAVQERPGLTSRFSACYCPVGRFPAKGTMCGIC